MAKNSQKSGMPSGPGNGKKIRPNFARQMLYAGIAVASIVGGYFLIKLMTPKPSVSNNQASSVQPWYQKQSPPPGLITTPDEPLFPEPDDEGVARQKIDAVKTARAYEEALPKEIYEPPTPAPLKIEPARPAPEKIETSAPIDTTAAPPPWLRYAIDYPAVGEGPMIAIVIDDMGVDKLRSARAMKMKGPLTLSFLTYAENLAGQTSLARSGGHELLLHVSMEPVSKAVDPGPNALLTGLADDELKRRLDWGFARFSGYVGINNHMGSKFTADGHAMQLVIEAVKRRGLLFLDSRTSARTVGAKLARQLGVPLAERNIFIDHVNTLDEVNDRLQDVEKFARRNGFAVAIGHPRQATIEALEPWLESIQSRGFHLVPISTIVKMYGAS